jgi:hypothetical protein
MKWAAVGHQKNASRMLALQAKRASAAADALSFAIDVI